ncbi:unnamed protein product [Periconia digitata]|uniref:Uncharacterized protein n=1 Tax=Periconia digitata TaxID=1303443 RepID=A0A9W4U5C2_9PLEO|nr:unnamed protein product [Periconia digitata]
MSGNDEPFTAWGPFIRQPYVIQPTTRTDLIVAGIVFGLAMFFAIIATYSGIQQTKASRNSPRSAYIWMIWIELVACIIIAILCLLYLLECIRPSFYFYMGILLLWSIQIQLLLQIIINRIRIILADREKGRTIMISVAVIVTMLNISVFCVWMPARLQISNEWIHANEIWDRTEKAIYLVLDASLNWYFVRVVKQNLIMNGLEKYSSLVRFNQRIIVVSLLMDVMIIAAMSIPNSFVYAIFHPLAFLVKLNIEMSMANLIRRIALAKNGSNHLDFKTLVLDDSTQGVWWKRIFHPCKPSQEEIFSNRSPLQIVKTEEFRVSTQAGLSLRLELDALGFKMRTGPSRRNSANRISWNSSEILVKLDNEVERRSAVDDICYAEAGEEMDFVRQPSPAHFSI